MLKKTYYNTKITEIENKIPDVNSLATKSSLTPVENKNSYKHNSCILHVVLFSIFFIINVGIGAYSAYYKYINHNKRNVSKYDYVHQTTIY